MKRLAILAVSLMALYSCASLRSGGISDNYTLDVENDAVKEYFQKADATFSEKPGSISPAWFASDFGFRQDQPRPLTINVDSQNFDFVLARDKALKDIVFESCNQRDSVVITNLVPGTTYFYCAKDGNITLKRGTVTTRGQLRMIGVDKCFNMRDLGGWKGLGGRMVRYEQIYRGGSPGGTDRDGRRSDLDESSRDEMYRVGVRAQLDLRAASDKGRYPHELSLHSYSRGDTPFKDADFNNTMTDNGAYCEDASLVCDLAWIIYELKRGKPVYFNCRQGADRTGAVAFLVEGLLGCFEYSGPAGANQMAMDYELTGFSRANLVDNLKVAGSYRGPSSAYQSKGKIFRHLIDLDIEGDGTLQQKCYWYLNRSFADQGIAIDDDDLDWFIMHMLGISAKEYSSFRPSFAADGGNLKEIGEKMANVVSYNE